MVDFSFLLHVLICTASILGIYKLFGIYPPFIWLQSNVITRLPIIFRDPLSECKYCMTSVYGTLYFITFTDYSYTYNNSLLLFLFYVCVIGALTQTD